MKKIALVNADNDNGGAARATRRIAKGLTQLENGDISIDFICNGDSESGYSKKSPVYNWPISFFYKNKFARRIFKGLINRLWKNFNLKFSVDSKLFFRIGNSINNKKTFKTYDIIHIFWGQTFINPGKIADLNKNVIVTLHDMWFLTGGIAFTYNSEDDKLKYLNFLGKRNFDNQFKLKEKLLKSEKTKIIVTSEWMKSKCIEFGINKKRIYKILNFIPDNYRYLDMKIECRHLLGWKNQKYQKKIIYFVGSLEDPRKGFNFLISAISLLSEELKSKIAVQVLGSKENKIQSLDNLNVEYLSLGIFSDDISQIIAYNAADILVCPSLMDNTPNVIAEAQMCGLPVFVRDGSGAAELIRDGTSGKIISQNYYADLTQKISNFLSNKYNFEPSVIKKIADLDYSLESTCRKYVDIYKRIN